MLSPVGELCRLSLSDMKQISTSRRAGKQAGSLDDSASNSGNILSYQSMPQDSLVKAVPADGTAELSSQAAAAPLRAKHMTRPANFSHCASAAGRSEIYLSSETSRSRLSNANLEQNQHAYRNHPQVHDYHGEHIIPAAVIITCLHLLPCTQKPGPEAKLTCRTHKAVAEVCRVVNTGWQSRFCCKKAQANQSNKTAAAAEAAALLC